MIDQLARDKIAELTEKVDEMERVWREEDGCVSADLETITEKVEDNNGGVIDLANRLSKVEAH